MKRYLLDTHVWLWALSNPKLLTPRVRTILQDPQGHVQFSLVSAWEISIKRSLGKLELKNVDDLDVFITRINSNAGVGTLPITMSDVCGVSELPWHHRDPFDRVLVAQAQAGNMALITNDPQLGAYDIEVIW